MNNNYKYTEIEASIHQDEAKIKLDERTKNGSFEDMLNTLKGNLAYFYNCWVDTSILPKDIERLSLEGIVEEWENSEHSTINLLNFKGSNHIVVYLDYNDDDFTFSGIYKIEEI